MRFPSKKSFVRASLVLVTLFPKVVLADVNSERISETEAAAPVATNAHFLNLAEARKAFGSEFSLEKVDGQLVLFGGTSQRCLDENFDIKNLPQTGAFQIEYKGYDATCLDHDAVVKDLSPGEYVGLNTRTDARMTPEGTFDTARLISKRAFSSKNPVIAEELKNDADESHANVSASDKAAKEKEEKIAKQQKQNETDFRIVEKCTRGLDELDIGGEALARLLSNQELVTEKGQEWFDAKLEKNREQQFQTCRKIILKARADVIASAKCEDRLAKLAAEDGDKYTEKTKSLYLELVNRYMNSETLGVEEAFTATMAAIEKVRDFAGSDLTDKESENLAMLERNAHLKFLNLAARDGFDSELYLSMRQHMVDYMIANDDLVCLADSGAILPNQRMNPACSPLNGLSLQLSQQDGLAKQTQFALNQKANEQLAIQNCTMLRTTASVGGTALNAADEARCKALDAAIAAKASAVANAGLGGDGFAEIVKTDAAVPAAANPVANDSGFVNTGYVAPIPSTSVTTSATTPGAALGAGSPVRTN